MAIFKNADFPWWIAGGLAIEHAVGRPLRTHRDIDVLLLHPDHMAAHDLLSGWDCWVADPPGRLRPWRTDECLTSTMSDIWCRATKQDPWRLQLMLDSGDRGAWRSRRCPLVSRPISDMGERDARGIPFLAPEIQLFYKSKAPRHIDEIDLEAALPVLSLVQKEWLLKAIALAYGPGNAWVTQIIRGIESHTTR
jgi:hypothetical protein